MYNQGRDFAFKMSIACYWVSKKDSENILIPFPGEIPFLITKLVRDIGTAWIVPSIRCLFHSFRYAYNTNYIIPAVTHCLNLPQ